MIEPDQEQQSRWQAGVQLSMAGRKPFKTLGKKTKKLRQRMSVHIYVLPNLLTTMNMFFGFFAIIYAINAKGVDNNFMIAAYAIVASAVFDLLDGRVARMTHSTSEFGAQYDSMSDLISFGMAPSILLFLWALNDFGRIGWLACFFYVACAGLRLARFNVQKDVIDGSYFEGLPSPMAAGIVASSVLAFEDLGWDAEGHWLLLSMTFLLGFTMVSNFRYRSFKDIDLRQRLPFRYLVLGVFIIAMIAIRPEVMLFVLFLTYACLGAIFGVLKKGRKPRKRLAGIDDSDLVDEDDLEDPYDADDSEETNS